MFILLTGRKREHRSFGSSRHWLCERTQYTEWPALLWGLNLNDVLPSWLSKTRRKFITSSPGFRAKWGNSFWLQHAWHPWLTWHKTDHYSTLQLFCHCCFQTTSLTISYYGDKSGLLCQLFTYAKTPSFLKKECAHAKHLTKQQHHPGLTKIKITISKYKCDEQHIIHYLTKKGGRTGKTPHSHWSVQGGAGFDLRAGHQGSHIPKGDYYSHETEVSYFG